MGQLRLGKRRLSPCNPHTQGVHGAVRPLRSPRVQFPLDTPALRGAGERRSPRVTQGEKVGPSFALTHLVDWGQSSLRSLSTASQACDVPPSSDKAGKTTQPHPPCCHPLSHTHVLGGWRGARATAGDLKDLHGPAARQTRKGIIALRRARQDTDGVATGMQRGAMLPRGQLGGRGHRGASQMDAQKPGRVTGWEKCCRGGMRRLGVQPQLCHGPAVGHWASHYTSASLGFPT